MFFVRNPRYKFWIGFLCVVMICSSSLTLANESQDIFSQTEEKLNTVSKKQQEVLQQLFFILQDIEEMERQEEERQKEIKKMDNDIEDVAKAIKEKQTIYENRKDTLKEVLRSYQRRGPASYLEIILTSDNFSDLVRRINILRDLTRNTGELLGELDERKEVLETEKKKLDDALLSLEEKQKELRGALLKNQRLRDEKEAYLTSLDTQRSYYEEQLDQVGEAWEEAKGALIDSIAQFSDVLRKGDLPFEAAEIKITLGGVKASIDEETFNELAKKYLVDKETRIHFYKDKITVEIPRKQFSLSGSFIIVDQNTLQFVAEEGTFYGMALTNESIQEIFREGALQLNLEAALFGNKLKSVNIKNGYLEITSSLSL